MKPEKFEDTPRGRDLAAKVNSAAARLADARAQYRQVLSDSTLLSEEVRDLEALDAVGETPVGLAKYRADCEHLQGERARLEDTIAALERAAELLDGLVKTAREEYTSKIAPLLIENRRKAAAKLVNALEGAVAANAAVAATETELRAHGIPFGKSLIYPDLGHEFVSNTFSMGVFLKTRIETVYSRFLNRCALAGVDVPRSGVGVPASVALDSSSSEQFKAGAAAGQAVMRPQLAEARSFIERVQGFFQHQGYSL